MDILRTWPACYLTRVRVTLAIVFDDFIANYTCNATSCIKTLVVLKKPHYWLIITISSSLDTAQSFLCLAVELDYKTVTNN